MKIRVPVICWLLLTIAWMAVIFGFSSQSGEASGGLSAIISQPITDAVAALCGGLSADAEAELYLQIDGVIRTVAHFSEYAVLGIWLTLLLKSFGLKKLWLPALAGVLFAITDEVHQSFVPDRVLDPVDVLVDTLGVIFGVVLINILSKVWRKKHVHHS